MKQDEQQDHDILLVARSLALIFILANIAKRAAIIHDQHARFAGDIRYLPVRSSNGVDAMRWIVLITATGMLAACSGGSGPDDSGGSVTSNTDSIVAIQFSR
ncbi:hypothetical protein HXX25_06665 [Hyphobacterium sp. CCMP332]|uniref:hypothetical protein n=1 Tax=Hyphobacterium sp. CCMP332 TaxID=2749086 RepID=UPI00164FC692|nr:hypothetical protein [Hyphobacterium sp. CCMP332]QNL19032.1 hypothetical protein HXX25_06665 [Hyphobacterium sp. CCMP332]